MYILLRVFCLLLAWGASAAWAGVTPTVQTLGVDAAGATESVVISFDRPVAYRKLFRLDKPDRVVIDLPRVEAGMLKLPSNYRGRLLRSVRSGLFDPETTRIVLELTGPLVAVEGHQVGKRLEFELTAGPGVRPAVDEPKKTAAPSSSPPSTKPVKPTKPGLPLVVIDAGHGGKDPGAAGTLLPMEKNVTLRIARGLRDALNASGRYRALLTREDDRFILLGERVRIAQRAGGTIFISLHADSASVPSAHGLSVYTVSETASDAEAQKLADQENSVDVLAGFKVDVEDAEAASILIELAQRDTRKKGAEFADKLVGAFGSQGIRLLPQPHRFAGFRVLKAPDIPSVLIETGFLSNPADERLLASAEYPKRLSQGILKGLDGYFAARKASQP